MKSLDKKEIAKQSSRAREGGEKNEQHDDAVEHTIGVVRKSLQKLLLTSAFLFGINADALAQNQNEGKNKDGAHPELGGKKDPKGITDPDVQDAIDKLGGAVKKMDQDEKDSEKIEKEQKRLFTVELEKRVKQCSEIVPSVEKSYEQLTNAVQTFMLLGNLRSLQFLQSAIEKFSKEMKTLGDALSAGDSPLDLPLLWDSTDFPSYSTYKGYLWHWEALDDLLPELKDFLLMPGKRGHEVLRELSALDTQCTDTKGELHRFILRTKGNKHSEDYKSYTFCKDALTKMVTFLEEFRGSVFGRSPVSQSELANKKDGLTRLKSEIQTSLGEGKDAFVSGIEGKKVTEEEKEQMKRNAKNAVTRTQWLLDEVCSFIEKFIGTLTPIVESAKKISQEAFGDNFEYIRRVFAMTSGMILASQGKLPEKSENKDLVPDMTPKQASEILPFDPTLDPTKKEPVKKGGKKTKKSK